VAKVIEFYIPNNFRKKLKWISPELRGKIVPFAPPVEEIVLTNVAPGVGVVGAPFNYVLCD